MYRFRLPASNTSPGALVRAMAASVAMVGLWLPLSSHALEFEYPDVPAAWGLGIGAASSQQPYTDIDRDNEAVPLLYYENRYVRIFGPGAEFKLPSLIISDAQQVNLSLVARYDSSGYEEGDARILDDMDDRDGGFWAGAKMEWENEFANIYAEWLGDVSGNSDGQRLTLGIARTWTFGERLSLTPRLAAIWQDDKYVDYYFGVRDSEVRSDRAAYAGKSGTNTELGVRGTYMFDKRHSVIIDVKATSLADEIKDSPLVDSSTDNRVLFGYLYRF
ncbi:MipA/OmpV family protein [Stutzerimonas nosocomialis]|uniref:MipA/OmpV family protein n=1 Tax=Stutzerimonas nosocomialis TaxID=1056496 RepID=A0A5R9QAZ2_9GAMM|nr:MipA/OmpV family protein [Stutzerimonas nosocomialis]TLX62261.1 MipA/OmpV family protein [Stutzerimonas nosocomialis]